MNTEKKGLRFRFIFLVTSLIILTSCLSFISTVTRERALLLNSITAQSLANLDSFILSTAQFIESDGDEKIKPFSDILLEKTSISKIIVLSGGKILYEAAGSSYLPSAEITDYNELKNIRYFFRMTDYFRIKKAAPPPAGTAAEYEIILSLAEVKRLISQIMLENSIQTLIIAIFGFFVAVFLSEVVLRPLDTLIRGVKKIASGDYSHRVSLESEKEISILGHEINLMAENLEKTIDSAKFISLGRLSASIAHEIRTPLVSIGGLIQLWKKDPLIKKYADDIEIILKEVDRLNNVVNQLLNYAKPPENKKKKISLSTVLEEILCLLRPAAEKNTIKITCRYGEIPEMLLDEEKVKQIFLNVIMNAVQAIKKKGTIIIETGEDSRGIFTRISDTGPGVPPAIEQNIFEPFISTRPGGTGLGLSIARKLAAMQNAELLLEKNSPAGAVFLILFRKDSPHEPENTHS